jgi:hypothetical protein
MIWYRFMPSKPRTHANNGAVIALFQSPSPRATGNFILTIWDEPGERKIMLSPAAIEVPQLLHIMLPGPFE